MALHIATENPHDAVCLQLIAELSAELGPRYGGDGSARFKPEDVAIARAAFVVAWLDGEAVGCGALRPMPAAPHIAEIKRMFVRRTARGNGLSREILSKLEALACEYGYESVQLETGDLQTEAIGLYESAAYERIPCYEPYTTTTHSICYGKRLPSAGALI